jgi:hypothetical protein
MSDYDLSLTGAQIDSALSKVHNADSTPTNGSQNMITSDAVHDSLSGYVSGQLVTDFSAVNNTTVPTTQAVSDFVASGSNIARFTTANSQTTRNSQTTSHINMTESIDPGNIASVSGSTITLGQGCYSVIFSGLFCASQGFSSHWDIRYITWSPNNFIDNDHYRFDVFNRSQSGTSYPVDGDFKRLSINRGIDTLGSGRNVNVRVDIIGGGSSGNNATLWWKEVVVTIIKHL